MSVTRRTGGRPEVDRPIFFLGMPRSGTTLTFSTFATHRDLAWISQYFARIPRFPSVTILSRLIDVNSNVRKSVARASDDRSIRERVQIAPSEAYEVWERCCGEDFAGDYLLGRRATADERRCAMTMVAKVTRYQAKSRFAAKVTGPGRIGYLHSIFEEARFINVIRDGRAVVESLMRVPFWRDTYRMTEPAWTGGLSAEQLRRWRDDLGGTPLALAALEWEAVLSTTRSEAAGLPGGRYAELRYEDFLGDPDAMLTEIARFCELPDDSRPHDFVAKRLQLRNMNFRWREQLSAADIASLNELLGASLSDLGYTVEGLDVGPSRGLLTQMAGAA